MALRYRHPDLGAHEPGCQSTDLPEPPCPDPGLSYVDVFCNCHRYTEPKVLLNGTDVAWPAGWTDQQAMDWRKRNGLIPPGEATAAQ